jgi:hypothetical protein
MKESPIFIKSYEMLSWLLHHTGKFPKSQRFVMAKRMEEAALDFHDMIVKASKGLSGQALEEADFHLARLKIYNRLCKDLKLHSFAQYEHLAGMLEEIGKLLGGWKKTRSRPARAG